MILVNEKPRMPFRKAFLLRSGNSVKECVSAVRNPDERSLLWGMLSNEIMRLTGESIEKELSRGT